METPADIVAEIRRDIGEIKEHGRPMSNSAAITINGGGAVALVVGLIGILGIVIAVSAVLVVSAWRAADMNDLVRVRGDVRELQAYRAQHGDRINKLEAKGVEQQTER